MLLVVGVGYGAREQRYSGNLLLLFYFPDKSRERRGELKQVEKKIKSTSVAS